LPLWAESDIGSELPAFPIQCLLPRSATFVSAYAGCPLDAINWRILPMPGRYATYVFQCPLSLALRGRL
jgi:hypothetical protein